MHNNKMFQQSTHAFPPVSPNCNLYHYFPSMILLSPIYNTCPPFSPPLLTSKFPHLDLYTFTSLTSFTAISYLPPLPTVKNFSIIDVLQMLQVLVLKTCATKICKRISRSPGDISKLFDMGNQVMRFGRNFGRDLNEVGRYFGRDFLFAKSRPKSRPRPTPLSKSRQNLVKNLG